MSLTQQFVEYDAANPQVFDKLVEICHELKVAGVNKIGIDYVHARLRWLADVEGIIAPGDYKFNTNFRPFYARKIMNECSDLVGMFDLRRAEADETM